MSKKKKKKKSSTEQTYTKLLTASVILDCLLKVIELLDKLLK